MCWERDSEGHSQHYVDNFIDTKETGAAVVHDQKYPLRQNVAAYKIKLHNIQYIVPARLK